MASYYRARLAGRYIFTEMLPGFIIGVLVFVFILLMFQALRLTEFVLMHNVGLKVIAKITLFLSISFLPAILPMSLLFAVLLTYGRLSNDSEIVAFKAVGLRISHLLAPSLILGLLVTFFSAQTCFTMAPWGNRQFELLIVELGQSKVAETIREGTFSESFFDLVVYANKVDSSRGLLTKVFIYDGRKEAMPLTIIAQQGQLIHAATGSNPSTTLRLTQGNIHSTNEQNYTKVDFDHYDIRLTIPASEVNAEKSPPSLSLKEVEDQLASPTLTPEKRALLSTEYHKRWAIPFACVIFSLLGVGLGTVTNRRSGKTSGLVLSLAIIVVYWGLYVTAESLARNGTLPAAPAIWAPNVLFFGLSLWSLKRAAR